MAGADLRRISERVINCSPKMRFVAMINLKGAIVEGIMKEGKTSLESQKEEEHFCNQVAQRRTMRKKFDKSLGRVKYVHVEREKVTQFVLYTKKYTIFFTVEPRLDVAKKIQLVARVKKLVAAI